MEGVRKRIEMKITVPFILPHLCFLPFFPMDKAALALHSRRLSALAVDSQCLQSALREVSIAKARKINLLRF